jgi:hypothetical protein
LKKLLGDESSFKAGFRGKKCGGFHPDYCVEWYADGQLYRCLICLGCWEVKVYGPDRELYCDMQHDVRDQLKKTLKRYRQNRPVSEHNAE